MSAASILNALLDPVLFQVIGSTPESIRDEILKTNLKNNSAAAAQLAAISVFAAAVNKPTMENFVSRQELQQARPFISQMFTISGKANMTGLTLLGHCLLTTNQLTGVTFCEELRKKMGQNSLWDGELDGGSLSDKQRKIMKEKKRVINVVSARHLGSCFFKHSGIDKSPMTSEELKFWGKANNTPAQGSPSVSTTPPKAERAVAMSPPVVPQTPQRAPPVSTPRSHRPSDSAASQPQAAEQVQLSNGEIVLIPADLLGYYRAAISDDPAKLTASIEKRGVTKFIADYYQAMSQDPEGRGVQGGTIYRGS